MKNVINKQMTEVGTMGTMGNSLRTWNSQRVLGVMGKI